MKLRTPALVIVATTVAGRAPARRLAEVLLAARLAACVQFFPIRSVYRWRGRRACASEYLVQAKTRAALAGRVTSFIRGRHPYELPEILVLPVRGAEARYRRWVADETRGTPACRRRDC